MQYRRAASDLALAVAAAAAVAAVAAAAVIAVADVAAAAAANYVAFCCCCIMFWLQDGDTCCRWRRHDPLRGVSAGPAQVKEELRVRANTFALAAILFCFISAPYISMFKADWIQILLPFFPLLPSPFSLSPSPLSLPLSPFPSPFPFSCSRFPLLVAGCLLPFFGLVLSSENSTD